MSKLSLDFAQKLAESRDGKCLSTEYVNSGIKMTWQCKNGHIWDTALNTVKNMNTWCRYCSHVKYTIGDCKKLAESKGGFCISDSYKDANIKLMWRCKENHVWEARLAHILQHWCKQCYHHSRKLTI